MIRLTEIYHNLLVEGMQTISMQDAIDRGMFGPVYHGTREENRDNLYKVGFDINYKTSNGYENKIYAMGYPPPIHHLGYGVYLTTVKSIAIRFNGDTAKGLKQFYVDCPRLETINFGSNNNMMKWWIKNGFDGELAKSSEEGRIQATKKLTDNLSSRFDAVWFKGKGLYRLLDGDQICVFDPKNIYLIDPTLSGEYEIGSKIITTVDIKKEIWDNYRLDGDGVFRNSPNNLSQTYPEIYRSEKVGETIIIPKNTKGIIKNKRFVNPPGEDYYEVKFARGGTQYNIKKNQIKPV